MREAATCRNRRAYYAEEIERIVVDGLRSELGVVPTPSDTVPGIIVRGRLNSLLGLDPFAGGSFVGGPGGAG
jgi:hypothetical protein